MDGKEKRVQHSQLLQVSNPGPVPWKSSAWLQKHENVKQKRGLCLSFPRFAWLFGAFRRPSQSEHFSEALTKTLSTKSDSCETKCGSAVTWKGNRFSSLLQKIKIITTSTRCWGVEAARKTSKIITPPTRYWEWVPLSLTDGTFWDSSNWR